MQHQKVIEQLGYSAKEAKVYLATLALGEALISEIAAKVKLPRSSVQVIAEGLHKKGLMDFYVLSRYKYWTALKPEILLEKLQDQEKILKDALPQLQTLRASQKRQPKRDKNYKKSVQILRMLADASLQPVLIANGDAETEYINHAWQEEFGYSLAEVKGKNPNLFKSGKTPATEYKRMWKALNAGTLFQSDKIVDKRKDGSFFKLLTTIFPVSHGNRTFYIQILDDHKQKDRAKNMHKNFVKAIS